MCACQLGLAAEVLAPSRFGMSENAYREIVEKIADQLALDDDEQSDHQRESDLEEAEWIVGVFYAAGFKPVPVAS